MVEMVAMVELVDHRVSVPDRRLRFGKAADPQRNSGRRHDGPELPVKVIYGASGDLAAQFINGAPFDMFLSADRQYAVEVVNRGMATPFSDFTYAEGHLVIWARKQSGLDVAGRGIEVLRLPEVKKIAIANPDTAPYGRAAKAALEHFELTSEVQEKLVPGESVAQAAHFVVSGGADVAIMAKSLAVAPQLRDTGDYWEIPAEAYPKIEQVGVTNAASMSMDAVQELKVFLLGVRGRQVLSDYGFSPPLQ
jgi:molybdate transport system substrate-binding protein